MLSHLKAVECQKWHFNCFQVGCFVKHKLETCYTHKVWIHNSAAVCIFRYVQWDVMLMKHQSHTWILWGVFGEKKRLRAVFLSPLKELFFYYYFLFLLCLYFFRGVCRFSYCYSGSRACIYTFFTDAFIAGCWKEMLEFMDIKDLIGSIILWQHWEHSIVGGVWVLWMLKLADPPGGGLLFALCPQSALPAHCIGDHIQQVLRTVICHSQ